MNRVLSLGLDGRWRATFARAIASSLPARARILDIACGTGDLGVAVKRVLPGSSIDGIDISNAMLDVARSKPEAAASYDSLAVADAANLPFEDASFDCAMCAFGFRNFPDRAAALKEAARVVRPGGRLHVLEFFRPHGLIVPAIVSSWLWLAPRIFARGALSEYGHLRRSIAAMDGVGEFSDAACAAGFTAISRRTFLPAATAVGFGRENTCFNGKISV